MNDQRQHHILRIDSSMFGDKGVSATLSNAFAEQLLALDHTSTITHRELIHTEIPHFGTETISAIAGGKAELSDQLIQEVQQADTLIIGAPMYNFGVASELKAWFDHIARAKVTFRYSSEGPVGLLTGKKVYVITTRGGYHQDKPSDGLTPFLSAMLDFLGLDDVEFIYVEGLHLGEEQAKVSIERATNTLTAAAQQHYPQPEHIS